MHTPLRRGAAALLLLCSCAVAAGEHALPPPPGTAALDGPGPGLLPPEGGDTFFMVHGPGPGASPLAGGPAQEVIHTLVQMEQLYRQAGRGKEVVPLYLETLGRTKDPLVRRFAYDAIVRAQLQPADVDKALATLKQSLDESLQRLNDKPEHDGKPRDGKTHDAQ